MSSHQEGKASIDDDVNARIRRESARVALKESAELAGVAHELKQKSVREAAETERELGRGRAAPRISQAVDYLFYIIYGLIGLQFVLKLMGARPGNGFVQFVAGVSWPLLAPFERIVEPPSAGAFQNDAWMKDKLDAGWKYGPVKNAETKERPCLVSFDQLPVEQQAKDYLFKSIVSGLARYIV